MTEAEWQACTDPAPMLEFLRGKASDRKLRLFACGSCRSFWPFLTDIRSREAVEMAEQYADGLVRRQDLRRVAGRASNVFNLRYSARLRLAMLTANIPAVDLEQAARPIADVTTVGLLRDMFGNPFRPFRVDQSCLYWNDTCIPKIARGIYEERAFDRLLILHDALLDAGCNDEDILAHCSSEGPHVRGCWVIDLILGKS